MKEHMPKEQKGKCTGRTWKAARGSPDVVDAAGDQVTPFAVAPL